jgi:hypothetical protein
MCAMRSNSRETDRQTDCAAAHQQSQLLSGVTAAVLEVVANRHDCVDGLVVFGYRRKVQDEHAAARTDFARGADEILLRGRIEVLPRSQRYTPSR